VIEGANHRNTTIAMRLVADGLFMPLAEESACTSAPLLLPNSAGTNRLVPCFSNAFMLSPPLMRPAVVDGCGCTSRVLFASEQLRS
jgi:hypothetical protein